MSESRLIDAQTALGAGATNGPAIRRRLDEDLVAILIEVTALTGSMDVHLEWAPTDAGPWATNDAGPDSFAQITTTVPTVAGFTALGEYYRPVYNVTTGPVTFNVYESA